MYVELLLETVPDADRNRLQEQLRARGFDPLPMKAGVLLCVDLAAVRKLLPGVTGTEADDLPVPAELKDSVRSIRFFKPRSPHST